MESEQLVHGCGVPTGEVLALGIGPKILLSAGNVDRAWGDEGNEFVLVYWKSLRGATVVLESTTKPMWKAGGDTQDGFTEFTTGQCRAPFPRREWPSKATRLESINGSSARASKARDNPHDQALMAPQSSGANPERVWPDKARPRTPFLHPPSKSGSMSE